MASFRPSTGERFLDINGEGRFDGCTVRSAEDLPVVGANNVRCGEKTMTRYIAVFMFVLIVGVCSYVVLNPGSYSTLVLCLASFVLCVAILAVAPVWKLILLLTIKTPNDSLGPESDWTPESIVPMMARQWEWSDTRGF